MCSAQGRFNLLMGMHAPITASVIRSRTGFVPAAAAVSGPMDHWLTNLASQLEPCVILAVVQAEGSTPRETGARMVVSAHAAFGTIGGGQLEWKAVQLARELLHRTSDQPLIERVALGPSLGQCCGGAVTLVLERIDWPQPGWVQQACDRYLAGDSFWLCCDLDRRDEGRQLLPSLSNLGERVATGLVVVEGARLFVEKIVQPGFDIAVFGAGHVGRALVAALALLPCRLSWIDERQGMFPDTLPANVRAIAAASPLDWVDHIAPGGFVLVLTHSHALDQALCEKLLRRDDLAYTGLIGSATKRATFQRRLAQRGLDTSHFARLTCPIGVDGIEGKEPAVIAAAVVAQILQVRERLAHVLPGAARCDAAMAEPNRAQTAWAL